MSNPRPDSVNDAEWAAIEKAKQLLTEYFPNTAIFINWVNETGETKRGEILNGNTFAIKHHIECWMDGDFELDDDDEEKSFH